MNANGELDSWRVLWQAEVDAPSAADLRDRIARETRRKKILLIAPISVTLAIGGWVISRAMASARSEDVVLALETWLFIGIIWIGSLWIERGTWRPLADTTRGFVDLSIRRCQSIITGLRFATILYLAQLAFILSWQLRDPSIAPEAILMSRPMILIGWAGVPGFLAFAVWFSRKKRQELVTLVDLQRQLAE
jgi:hypothetical protein